MTTVLITLFVSGVAFKLLTFMYKNHRMVFKSHAKTLFSQATAILISSLIVFTFSYTNVLLNSCLINEGAPNFFEYYKFDRGGVCNKVYSVYFFLYSKKSGIIIQLMFELILSLVPISIFLLTQKPHDCFMCLGRDPDSCAYSVFQTNFIQKRPTAVSLDDSSLEVGIKRLYKV